MGVLQLAMSGALQHLLGETSALSLCEMAMPNVED